MKTLLIISAALFCVNVLIIVILFRVPSSLSYTYYLLKKKYGKAKYLFTLMCWACSFTLMPTWLDISHEDTQFLAFLACGGLCFVGTAAAYLDDMTKTVHYTAAAICGLSTLLWLFLSGIVIVPLSLLLVATVISIFNRKNTLWWYEISLFASCYTSLLSMYYHSLSIIINN